MIEEWTKVKVPQPNAISAWVLCGLWCSNNFGAGFTPDRKWSYLGEGVYEFQNDQDAVMFSLKWMR